MPQRQSVERGRRRAQLPAAERDPAPETTWGHSVEERAEKANAFAVHVGVDAGKTFHKLVARKPHRDRLPPFRVEVSRSGFEEADLYLRTTFPKVARGRFLVGIEFGGNCGSTFAGFLGDRGYRVVSVSALAVARTREVEDRSPRKDDDKDAGQICQLLASGVFSSIREASEWTASARCLIREREFLTRDAVRIRHRLGDVLHVTWPEFLVSFPRLSSDAARTVLETWPLPSDIAQLHPQTMRRLVRGIVGKRATETWLNEFRRGARETIGLHTAREERRAELGRLMALWSFLQERRAEIDDSLQALVEMNPRARALTTIPQVGPLFAAIFLSELGDVNHFTSPRQVVKLAGLNLIRRQSGTSLLGAVHGSKHGRPFLRHHLYMLGVRWVGPGGFYRDEHAGMIKRNGGSAKKSICAVARRLVPLLLRIAQTGEPFDEAKWIRARNVGRQ